MFANYNGIQNFYVAFLRKVDFVNSNYEKISSLLQIKKRREKKFYFCIIEDFSLHNIFHDENTGGKCFKLNP